MRNARLRNSRIDDAFLHCLDPLLLFDDDRLLFVQGSISEISDPDALFAGDLDSLFLSGSSCSLALSEF